MAKTRWRALITARASRNTEAIFTTGEEVGAVIEQALRAS